MYPVNHLRGFDYDIVFSDFLYVQKIYAIQNILFIIIHRDYNSRNISCDIVVREAERELYEDNYLLFLMYKACRDLYCQTEV